ncbi:MAG TPA: hypothetical protein VIH31_02280 [Candidatus Paceibacterota bacterium]
MKKTFILFFLPYVLFLPQTLFGQSVEEIKQIVKPFGLVKEEFIGGKSDRFIIFIAQQHELDLTFPFNIMITDTGAVKRETIECQKEIQKICQSLNKKSIVSNFLLEGLGNDLDTIKFPDLIKIFRQEYSADEINYPSDELLYEHGGAIAAYLQSSGIKMKVFGAEEDSSNLKAFCLDDAALFVALFIDSVPYADRKAIIQGILLRGSEEENRMRFRVLDEFTTLADKLGGDTTSIIEAYNYLEDKYSHEREQVAVNKALKVMKAQHANTLAIVFGAGHFIKKPKFTNFQKLCQQKGINYVVIYPYTLLK